MSVESRPAKGVPAPAVMIVMGVSGSGKSTIGALLARRLHWEFEDADWEQELMDFYKTDIDVPAKLTVDGKVLPDVGIHFRGMTSYMVVPKGKKHSINLSVNFVNKDQRVAGYRTLNLLNSNSDPTYLRTVLYHYVARQFFPAPKANFVRVVINGESWGIYANQQIFNKEFLQENYKTSKGARWKVPGHPGASGGLNYIGDNIADYKRHYEIKSADDDKAWKALIALCKTLDKTPLDKLEETLEMLKRMVAVFEDDCTIERNFEGLIALSNPNATLEQIVEAARRAVVDDDIRAMPMGYDTVLADGGAYPGTF